MSTVEQVLNNFRPREPFSQTVKEHYNSKKLLIVWIEGTISAGKTTICEELEKRSHMCGMELHVVKEPIESWRNLTTLRGQHFNLLDEFYKDAKKNAFIFQLNALHTRCKNIKEAIRKFSDRDTILFVERGPFTDMCVFSALLHESNCIRAEEMGVYESFFEDYITEMGISADAIIHLSCETETSYIRLKKRNRSEESTVDAEYLKLLLEKEISLMHNLKTKVELPILKIDSNDLGEISDNINEKIDKIEEFVKKIKELPSGHFKMIRQWKELLPIPSDNVKLK